MLVPHIKSKVQKLWNLFWSAGITNPLVAVEQITYLLFLKRLEGLDNERIKKGRKSIYVKEVDINGQTIDGNLCRWSYIEQDKSPQHLINVVFPWLRELEKRFAESDVPANGIESIGNRMSDAYFQLDPNKGAILQQAIELVNELFSRVDAQGNMADIMGDTFEYLLSEIATAGMNGQFRTPRHIIRTMVELVDPQPGDLIIDPAAGTGGFLFSSLSYILAQHTAPESLRMEWDGALHRADGDQFSSEEYNEVHASKYYVGLDNDRTMVRIGWMNMILHGIENPQIFQRDSLSKRREDDSSQDLLGSEQYNIVLANPPFTGTIDADDLDGEVFPKQGKAGKKSTQVITNKSELLFVWRMLDLLRVGGRCAVIVPEGVLFGNTEGHVALRRELLTEHKVEAVISLPGGVFQPYTGVKTSILVFQKETRRADRRQWKPVDVPRTHQVWFYEVEQEAMTLDAKHSERRGEDNDLWDMLAKYRLRDEAEQNELDYYQPAYHTERWRLVDDRTLGVFADDREVRNWPGKIAAIHELFAELPPDPEVAYAQIYAEQQPRLVAVAKAVFAKRLTDAGVLAQSDHTKTTVENVLRKATTEIRGLCEQHKGLFDQEEKVAYLLYQKDFRAVVDSVGEELKSQLIAGVNLELVQNDDDLIARELQAITLQYARLDGYDVVLRSLETLKQSGVLKETKHWLAPVRVFAENPEWESEDGKIQGSHDEAGALRPEYVASIKIYDEQGKLNEDVLDPDCIEARSWNLSAGQYKPFRFETVTSDKTVADMIADIKGKEMQIIEGLDRLLAMVNGK